MVWHAVVPVWFDMPWCLYGDSTALCDGPGAMQESALQPGSSQRVDAGPSARSHTSSEGKSYYQVGIAARVEATVAMQMCVQLGGGALGYVLK